MTENAAADDSNYIIRDNHHIDSSPKMLVPSALPMLFLFVISTTVEKFRGADKLATVVSSVSCVYFVDA